MTVWVLETGRYADRIIRGIFSTPEKAMAAWPARPDMARSRSQWGDVTPIQWAHNTTGGWSLDGADWDDAADATPYEVDKRERRPKVKAVGDGDHVYPAP